MLKQAGSVLSTLRVPNTAAEATAAATAAVTFAAAVAATPAAALGLGYSTPSFGFELLVVSLAFILAVFFC
jgi:hypothetical protein